MVLKSPTLSAPCRSFQTPLKKLLTHSESSQARPHIIRSSSWRHRVERFTQERSQLEFSSLNKLSNLKSHVSFPHCRLRYIKFSPNKSPQLHLFTLTLFKTYGNQFKDSFSLHLLILPSFRWEPGLNQFLVAENTSGGLRGILLLCGWQWLQWGQSNNNLTGIVIYNLSVYLCCLWVDRKRTCHSTGAD